MNAADAITTGRTALGIELGSTRIKACLIAEDDATVLATGSHEWASRYEDGHWTYSLDEIEAGLQGAYAAVAADAQVRHGVRPSTLGSLGISAMMHGYLAFDDGGRLLTPFRTWRDTTTGLAAAELSGLLGVNIPLRWSIAHLHQAVLDDEDHVSRVHRITTLAGHVHERLTGRAVLGVGDASGMFPIDPATGGYDQHMLAQYDSLVGDRLPGPLLDLLPDVLPAGAPAGTLTAEGARFLDPTGALQPGVPLCPPEGDAGTGMVATNSISPRTGNVSAGTSIFAMVVLDEPLGTAHPEIDIVTTPVGSPVAMVHCNNGASELASWVEVFVQFARAASSDVDHGTAYDVLFREALVGEADAGGLVAYNFIAGEPIAGLSEGRPLLVRMPDSPFTLANLMRAQLFGVFATLALGMRLLASEGVSLERLFAHGGMFHTAGVAQRFLAGALEVPVAVGDVAAEGGAWGMAVLAAYLRRSDELGLPEWLDRHVFASAKLSVVDPQPEDIAGFRAYLQRYQQALPAQAAAVHTLPSTPKDTS